MESLATRQPASAVRSTSTFFHNFLICINPHLRLINAMSPDAHSFRLVVNFAITAGPHTVMWAYSKDASGSAGSDTAWVDEVNLPLQQSSTSNSFTPDLLLLGD